MASVYSCSKLLQKSVRETIFKCFIMLECNIFIIQGAGHIARMGDVHNFSQKSRETT